MPRSSEAVYPPRGRARVIGVSLLLCFLGALFVGCGISLSADHSQTEVFKKLDVIGPMTPSSALTMELDYEQPYSVALDVLCDLLIAAKAPATPTPTKNPLGTPTPTPVRVPAPETTPANRLSVIINQSIPENPTGTTTDESTPVPGSLTHNFNAPDKPGRYLLRCYTPADHNNQILKSFRIR